MWHLEAQHCLICSAVLVEAVVEGRKRKRCSKCTFVLFQNPACAAGGVVLDDERRVLLIQRRIAPYRGAWAFPAGYQELDEAPEETVVREVYEETGITARVIRLLELVYVRDDHRKPANVAIYLCHARRAELRPADDALAAAWFDLDALPEHIGFENNRGILERLRDPEGYAGRPWPPPAAAL